MADLTSICGQIRGLESKLLTKAQVDRMVGSEDASAAFRVLVELQYADYIEQNTELSDFDAIITQGLYETRNLLIAGCAEHPVADFLTLGFDINNLKRALKQRLLESAKEFSVDESFSKLGRLSVAEINKIVFDNLPAGNVSPIVMEAVSQALSSAKDVRDIEFALDAGLFSTLAEILADNPNAALEQYLALWADSVQIRNLGRAVLVMEEPLPEVAFVPVSTINFTLVGKTTTYADFKKVLEQSRFSALAAQIDDNAEAAVKLMALESGVDKILQRFLHESSIGSLNSPLILIYYFTQRLQNARILKLVMYGKLNGVSSDKIYQLIENVWNL